MTRSDVTMSESETPGFLRNRFGENYLHEVNRQSFVSQPSEEVFERRLDPGLDADDTLFFVVGSDSGLLHHYLSGLPLGKGSKRIIVEADELFDMIALRTKNAGDKVSLCRISDWPSLLETSDIASYAHGGSIRLVESLGCQHDHDGRYVTMLRRIRADVATAVHRNRVQVSGQIFVRKQLQNACENRVPASVLRGLGEGHTAMVLGGGPSLDDAIDWVIKNRESLFLIVAARLCARLQSLEIRPDVVVAVDPQAAMFDLSREGLYWTDVPLVSAYHLDPQLVQQWRGPGLFLGETHPWSKPSRKDDVGNFPSIGPTVSHTGVWLAFKCGFTRILMSGIDMCFTVGGGSHASGSVESLIGGLPSRCDATVVTYDGRMAGTERALEHGIEALEELGNMINADGKRLFNTSARAARIDSIPLIALADVPLSGSRPDIVLADDGSPAADKTRIAEHINRVHHEQGEAIRRFRTIRRRCDEAARLLNAMDEARDDKSYEVRQRRLERLEKALGKEHGPWFDMIKHYGSAELLASVKPSGFGEGGEHTDWGRNYYRVVKRIAKTFIELLDGCETRAKMRLAELEDEPDIDALLAYWAKDQTPGRVLLLRARMNAIAEDSTDASALPEHLARLDDEAEVFLAALQRQENRHETLIRESFLHPNNILRNLAFLFREKSSDDIEQIAAKLFLLGPPLDVFAGYAAGLHAELGGDTERALASYEPVLDRFGEWLEDEAGMPAGYDALLEDTLRQITQCYLEASNGDAAVNSLALLTQISPAYTSRYAHLQHLNGCHDEALQILEEHVQQYPDDWRVLLQIADIYSDLDATEAADMARSMAASARATEKASEADQSLAKAA